MVWNASKVCSVLFWKLLLQCWT